MNECLRCHWGVYPTDKFIIARLNPKHSFHFSCTRWLDDDNGGVNDTLLLNEINSWHNDCEEFKEITTC